MHLEATDGVVARDLRQIVAVSYSSQHTLLGTFGLEVKKERVPLTTAARLAATAKLQATRKAPGTTSRKQKLAITGNVVGVTVTPVTAEATGARETAAGEESG